MNSPTAPAGAIRARPGEGATRWPGGPWHSLGGKLLSLSVVLVVLPGVLFAWIALRATRSALETAVGRQLAEVANDASSRVDVEMDRLQRSVGGWARSEVPPAIARDGESGPVLSGLLGSLAGSDPVVGRLAYVDGNGSVTAASDPNWVGSVVRDRPWWPALEAGRGIAGSRWPRSGEPLLEIASPVPGPDDADGRPGALLFEVPVSGLSFMLQHLQHDLANQGLEPELLLIDASSTVMVGGWWRAPSALVGRNLERAGWRVVAPESRRSRPAYLRDDRIGALVGVATVSIPGLGWTTLAVQSYAEAFAPVRALRRVLVLSLAGILAAGILLAVVMARRLGRPIRELTEATRELSRSGEIQGPVPVRSRDEIADLAIAFNSMAEDLSRAREQVVAAAKLAFVGELAAGMAHEIRTPLGIVRSSAQILGRALSDGDHRGRELTGMIVEEVDRLERVVAGLLELARPRPPAFEAVSLASILGRAMDFLSGQAAERGITFRRELDGGSAAALCDPDQMYQVCLNLIVNALQVLSPGGTVTLRTFAAGDRVGFEVRDDGPGMPPDVQARLFTPFFTRRPGGTGLGLALVQRLVHGHRGTIAVESEEGRGTCFRVEIPAAEGNG